MTRKVDKGRELENEDQSTGQIGLADRYGFLFFFGEVVGFKQRAMTDLLDLCFEGLSGCCVVKRCLGNRREGTSW